MLEKRGSMEFIGEVTKVWSMIVPTKNQTRLLLIIWRKMKFINHSSSTTETFYETQYGVFFENNNNTWNEIVKLQKTAPAVSHRYDKVRPC
jgi:hypothetical protein